VAERLVEWPQAQVASPLEFIVAVNLLLLAVGCVMTIDAAVVVLAQLLAPLAQAYGFDPVLLGVLMLLNLKIGFLTPPAGVNCWWPWAPSSSRSRSWSAPRCRSSR
jgi:C4-dicarboxylate transporter DctM subunit